MRSAVAALLTVAAYGQPAAAAREPVFWTEPTRPDEQSHPPVAADATAQADPSAGDVPAEVSEPA
ncbi:MAG: hypothetical protein ACKVVO_03685 [Opitutaceae bacterium]